MRELKFAVTMWLQVSLTEQVAMERYGTVDPYVIAAAMTREGNKDIVERVKRETGEVHSGSLVVQPVGG